MIVSEKDTFPTPISDEELAEMRAWYLATGDGPSDEDFDRIEARIEYAYRLGIANAGGPGMNEY